MLAAQADLPGRLAQIAPSMAADDWLGSYRDFAVLEQVFRGIARRLSRPEGMDGALELVDVLYAPLMDDFRSFYPELQAFAGKALAQA
ncbi:acyl carrier protein phosphodiesterase [compost metagenome]